MRYQNAAERPPDPDRHVDGRFKKGNRAGCTLGKQNNTTYGEAQAARLERDVELHGSESLALDKLINGPKPFAVRLRDWREDTVKAYGGWDAMNPLSHHLLDMCTIGKVLLDSIGSYATKTRLVNRRSRRCYPIVETLSRLMDAQSARIEKFAALMTQTKQEAVTPISERLKALENGEAD